GEAAPLQRPGTEGTAPASPQGPPAAGRERAQPSLAQTLGEVVYWLVFLLFLPAILSALQLPGLLAPVQGLLDEILAFLPNLAAAALILVVGWFVARIVQRITTGLLAAAGVDRLAERVGVSRVLGTQTLSGVLGLLVFVLIVIPVVIAALNALQLETISQPASNMLNAVLAMIPRVFAAAVILGIAYVVGRLLASLVAGLLAGFGFDTILARLGFTRQPGPDERTPAQIAGYAVLVATLLFAAIEAAEVLGFAVLADIIRDFTVFAGHVLLGLIILAIGIYLANLVAGLVRGSDIEQAGLLATAARVAILVLAAAMALRQMGLANDIINLAFGLLLGAIAVAVALAFGLGSREVAGREVERWVAGRRGAGGQLVVPGQAAPPSPPLVRRPEEQPPA
ncbi:MAG TPA: mechanosensitive ion channel, partial [Vicinamibacteria bacterium]|nr:mechanosensitive ion channel [Vicinamibacteria bacterium]